MNQSSLFDSTPVFTPMNPDWRPMEPPCLDGIDDIDFDTETDGLRWWNGNLPIGIAIGYGTHSEYTTRYLPWGHQGGNLDEATVKRWAQRELRGKRLIGANNKFDFHMIREWGVNLEEQGCTFSDVQHQAALLDSHRRRFNIDLLAQEYLAPGSGKIGQELDKTRMRSYHAGDVAAYAEYDVKLVRRLENVFNPQLDAQNLQRVRKLEDALIPVVCEMEKNAAPIDVELLERWLVETAEEYHRCLWRVAKAVGFQVSPGKTKDVAKLYRKLGIPITAFTEPTEKHPEGQPSFTDAVLKLVDHPVVKDIYRAAKLEDLRSKVIVKFHKTVGSDRLLRYALHQLRSDEGGTITGRFSSSALDRETGVNVQQVPAVGKQVEKYGEGYLARQLFVPGSGFLIDCDAKQIEYRIFADKAANPKVMAEYAKNPDLKFHNLIWDMIKPYKPDLIYEHCKNMNFCFLYGGGLAKLASMLGFITEMQLVKLRKDYPKGVPHYHPMLATAKGVKRIYDRELPEVRPLLQRYTEMAEQQGYVETVLGRRIRMDHDLHKAFNGYAQGSAADVMKLKLIELHAERAWTGMTLRMTVHDSAVGDVPDAVSGRRVQELLNRQSVPEFKVPILWDVKVGLNWAQMAKPSEFDGTKLDGTRGGRSR